MARIICGTPSNSLFYYINPLPINMHESRENKTMKRAEHITLVCKFCQNFFELPTSTVRARMKAGFMPKYCCQKHYIKDIKNVFQKFANRERNLEIAKAIKEGQHWTEVKEKYGLTRQRITAIAERYASEI